MPGFLHTPIPRILIYIVLAVMCVLLDNRTSLTIAAHAVFILPVAYWFGRAHGAMSLPAALLATTPFWALLFSDGPILWSLLWGKAATIGGLFWAGWMAGTIMLGRTIRRGNQ